MNEYAQHNEVYRELVRFDQRTHKDKIVDALTQVEGRWLCGTTFLRAYLPTYSQRIGELKNDGFNIESRACDNPTHEHRSSVAMYRLVADDD